MGWDGCVSEKSEKRKPTIKTVWHEAETHSSPSSIRKEEMESKKILTLLRPITSRVKCICVSIFDSRFGKFQLSKAKLRRNDGTVGYGPDDDKFCFIEWPFICCNAPASVLSVCKNLNPTPMVARGRGQWCENRFIWCHPNLVKWKKVSAFCIPAGNRSSSVWIIMRDYSRTG